MEPALLLLFGGAIIVFAVLTYAIVQKLTANDETPQAEQVRQAIKVYINRAIHAGEHLALAGIDSEEQKLTALDRKAIADKFYDLLPDTLWIFGIPLPLALIKAEVSREEFERLVENEYKEAIAFIEKHKATLQAQIGKYVEEPEPPAPTFTLQDALKMVQDAVLKGASQPTITKPYTGGALTPATATDIPQTFTVSSGSTSAGTAWTQIFPPLPPADPQPTPEPSAPQTPPAAPAAAPTMSAEESADFNARLAAGALDPQPPSAA